MSKFKNTNRQTQAANPLMVQQSNVQQSLDIGCIISKCGWSAIGCVRKCGTTVSCYIDCIGSAAPSCMACFS